MRKIVVTGGSGFIGKHSLDVLKQKDFDIYAISRTSIINDDRIKWITLDLFNKSEVDSFFKEIRPDILLHLAWITTPGEFYDSEVNNQWLEASTELIDSFIKFGGKKILAAGSSAEYNWKKNNFSEDSILDPISLYGKTKLQLYKDIKKRSETKDIDFIWGRIFNVFGTGENKKKIIPLLINAALKKNQISCLSKHDLRDFIHVKDVANLFVFLLENNFNGSINLATGKGTSILEIVKLIEKKLMISNSCTFKQNYSKYPFVVGDNSKLKKMGYNFLFDLEKGLEEAIKWWKSENIK